ncbi:uroporphyrinogen III methyltransferase [Acidisoma sp. C75]
MTAGPAMPALPVLVTRPEPGGRRTTARLLSLGFAPVLAPLLRVDPLTPALPAAAAVRAVVVASRHALPALPASYRRLPLFAVGDATAEAARRAGFAVVRSAGGRAEDLAALVAQSLTAEGLPLLLAAGLGQGHRLNNLLQESGFAVLREEVYVAQPVAELPESAAAMIRSGQEGWILLFSRETALCFARLAVAGDLAPDLARFSLAAIGEPAAAAASALPWRRVRVAVQPTETAVLALLND